MSIRVYLTPIFILIIFATELPMIASKAPVSGGVDDNEIRREVNDGFTITKKDKDFFEQMNNNIRLSTPHPLPGRIVAGQEASLGKY